MPDRADLALDLDPILRDEEKKYSDLRVRHPRYGFGTRQAEWLRRRDNPFTRFFVETLRDPAITTALDVGCGGGTVMDLVQGWVDVQGIEIYGGVVGDRPDLMIHHVNAARMPFGDDAFDVVYHLDGMEHIPIETEREVLRHEFRVARRFVFHEISLVPSAKDASCIALGQTPLHINLKTDLEWLETIGRIGEERGFEPRLVHREYLTMRPFSVRSTLSKVRRWMKHGSMTSLCLVFERDASRALGD